VQLTKKASYGLIAAVELAHDPGEHRSASTIAERYSLPAPFVEKILHELRQAGLITSRQGRGGGYALARKPDAISIRQVLEALGECLDLVGCLGSGAHCDLTVVCPTKGAWARLDQRFKEMLASLSLADLVET